MTTSPVPSPWSPWRWPLLGLAALALAGGAFLALRPGVGPPPATGPAWFADSTDQAGLTFLHDAGPLDGRYPMPQIVGSGAALGDLDGDRRLDVYLLNNGGPSGRPNVLYLQQADGTFRDASAGSGLDFAGACMGVAVGDVDNDGRPDVVVTGVGFVRLFRNQGGGTFAEVSGGGVESPLWGTSACFLDYDRDGLLDLAVANYVDYDPAWPCARAGGVRDYCHPSVFRGQATKLFRNVTRPGGPVRFVDVTVASGLGRLPGPGLGVVAADFDGDGAPDLFVANDAQANHLWMNQRDGTFVEDGVARGVAYDGSGRPLANMGIALADLRGVGRFDVFVTHLTEETNTLWRQVRPGVFVDSTTASGLARGRWRGTGFGTCFADFDNDGQHDAAVANGRVARPSGPPPQPDAFWAAYSERNQLFAGTGPGTFRDISDDQPALCGTPTVARGLVVGDIDGDGGLDLLLTRAGGRVQLLRNVAANRGHWLRVRAIDPKLHRDAYGAEVTAEGTGWRRVGWVNPGQSYLCSLPPEVHFGLGSASAVERLRVRWPDGSRETFAGGPVDQVRELRKGDGTPDLEPAERP